PQGSLRRGCSTANKGGVSQGPRAAASGRHCRVNNRGVDPGGRVRRHPSPLEHSAKSLPYNSPRRCGRVHRREPGPALRGLCGYNRTLTMNTQTAKLVDPAGHVLATARVSDEGEHHGGTIVLNDMPAEQRQLFEEFEEIVNGQMLSFL